MEDDEFIKKMTGVKPISKDGKETNKNKNLANKNPKKNKTKLQEEKTSSLNNKVKKSSDFTLSFGEVNKDLKRGRIRIDRRVDLHGYNLEDAHEKFKTEIIKTYNKNKRCILFITGKGINNKNNPNYYLKDVGPKLYYGKIKNSIVSWIEDENLKKYILTYQDAGIEHGGDGAIFVYLRKKN